MVSIVIKIYYSIILQELLDTEGGSDFIANGHSLFKTTESTALRNH